MHKWSLINKALDMGQPEPVETYSSSPHLYTDLDIPAGSKGRLKATSIIPKTVEAASRPPRERRDGDSSSRPPRERREGDRQRTRTRGGSGTAPATAGTTAPTDSAPVEGKVEGSGTHDGSTPARRRSRRRRPSGGAATPPPAA